MWKKLSIGKKLFIAMMTTVIVVIAFVALLLTLSMRAGFENYVLQAELDRFQPVVDELVELHDMNNPTWPNLRKNRRVLNELVRDSLPPPVGNQRLRQQAGLPKRNDNQTGKNQAGGNQKRNNQSQKNKNINNLNNNNLNRNNQARNPDPLQIGARFAVLGPNGQHIVGARLVDDDSLKREIRDSDGNVLGYIAMVKPGRTAGDQSSLFLIDQIKFLVLTLLVALILSAGAAYWLSRQFTRPVNRLVSGIKRLALGEYDLRLEKTSEDEFGNLVEQFNLLAEKLAEQEKSERRWMSDTSHELQTPLAVLRAEIEALQDGVRIADEKTLSTLHLSVTRLSALVKDISQLSHAREGQLVQNWSKTNLSALAEDAISKAIGLIEGKGLRLETELATDLIAECDAMRVSQLIDNILTNAMRYTAAPGVIKLTTAKDGDHAVIRVDDSNSPPPDEAMGKLFDRFYRVDQSRTRQSGELSTKTSSRTSGSGLGLSICELIAKAHHGEIKADMSPSGGMAMIFRVPLVRKNKDK